MAELVNSGWLGVGFMRAAQLVEGAERHITNHRTD